MFCKSFKYPFTIVNTFKYPISAILINKYPYTRYSNIEIYTNKVVVSASVTVSVLPYLHPRLRKDGHITNDTLYYMFRNCNKSVTCPSYRKCYRSVTCLSFCNCYWSVTCPSFHNFYRSVTCLDAILLQKLLSQAARRA